MSWRARVLLIGLTFFAVLSVALSNAATYNRTYVPTAVAPLPPSTPTASTTVPIIATSTVGLASTSANQLAGAAAAPITAPTASLTSAGGNLLSSLVNILCLPQKAGSIPGGSGSGVIIDSRGLIITAAHIGQYFLLLDSPKPNSFVCTIRTGGPASNAYTADLIYISPSWIQNNADVLKEKNPTGTGENDFAILAITGSAGKSLPSSFNYTPLSHDTPAVGEKVAIAGYSAQYLGNADVEHDLYPTISFTPISNVYTFSGNAIDVVSIVGTPAAQEGSSGGGVADANGTLVGVVSTSQISSDILNDILNAITPIHIRTSFASDMGQNLDTYLSSHSVTDLVNLFKPEATRLTEVLTNALFK